MGIRTLSGSRLKLIAMVSMLIDHFAAIVLLRLLENPFGIRYAGLSRWVTANWNLLADVYYVLRCVGRFAFPIYCFLLVEGFRHTRSVPRYALRLAAFCLLSEIPFDLAFQDCILEFASNNVFFTLLTGLLCVWAIDAAGSAIRSRPLPKAAGIALQVLLTGAVCTAGYALAEYILRCDYGGQGVAAIIVMYLLMRKPALGFLAGTGVLCIGNPIELYALPMVLPVLCYGGQRGRRMGLAPYLFYPVHLLLLWGISLLFF